MPGLAFGYEEAIGYCVDPAAVPDKDGISALVRVLVLAAELKAHGRSLADRLDEIARTYGVHETDQLSVRVDDLGLIAAAMARLRAHPPVELAGEPVEVTDLSDGQSEPAADRCGVDHRSRRSRSWCGPRAPSRSSSATSRLGFRSIGPTGLAEDRRQARSQLGHLRDQMSEILGLAAGGWTSGC